jgi:hypothetical protein
MTDSTCATGNDVKDGWSIVALEQFVQLSPEWEENYARRQDSEAGQPGQTAGQVGNDSSRRIRSGRNTPHSRGQARGAIGQAGDSHRALKSPARRSQASAPAQEREGQHQAKRKVCDARSEAKKATVSTSIPRHDGEAEA